LLALYHTMVMARAITRRLWVLRKLLPIYGEVARKAGGADRGTPGAEAIQVAAAAALRPGVDWIVPHHRDLALCLALGVSPFDVMMAMLAGTTDLGSRQARIVTTSGLVGTHMPHAAGIAYASKLQGRDEVTLASIDQRGTDTGDWHEALNFASTHKLPLVCLVQDDAPRATATPGQTATDLIVKRAHGYGMEAESIDGGDFDLALQALDRAADRARSGEGPTLVHARITALTSRTPRGSFQSQAQLEAVAHQDPIERMRRQLHESQLLDDDNDDQIQRDCITVVEAALDQARMSPMAEPAEALDNVFWGEGTNA
jgi:2-oxoisovalerate dehydrogenase E1 component alpha subunit